MRAFDIAAICHDILCPSLSLILDYCSCLPMLSAFAICLPCATLAPHHTFYQLGRAIKSAFLVRNEEFA